MGRENQLGMNCLRNLQKGLRFEKTNCRTDGKFSDKPLSFVTEFEPSKKVHFPRSGYRIRITKVGNVSVKYRGKSLFCTHDRPIKNGKGTIHLFVFMGLSFRLTINDVVYTFEKKQLDKNEVFIWSVPKDL